MLVQSFGAAWLRDHTARIQQRHLQFGRHCRLDIDSLLARAASLGQSEFSRQRQHEDVMRRATIEAVEHCLRLDVAIATAALEPTVP